MGMDCITMVRHTRTENYLPKEAAPKTPNSRWRITQEIVITECKVHHCSQMDQQKAPAKAGAITFQELGAQSVHSAAVWPLTCLTAQPM